MKSNKTSEDKEFDFASLFDLADLKKALELQADNQLSDAVLRFYSACVDPQNSARILEPLALLRQTLALLLAPGRVKRGTEQPVTNDRLTNIYHQVEHFESRVQSSAALLKTAPTPVAKTLHFVWLGGGVGDIQRDYLYVWRQVLAGQGYALNLWYDSDALLAHQTNKLIVEAAKADALAQVGEKVIDESALATLYEERAIVLKQQMYAHINAAVEGGESADEARIALLVEAYGQDRATLQLLRERNRDSVQALAGADLQLRDLDVGEEPLQLQDIYERETRLRGNLAAASDVVRAEVLYREGGSYADVDNLPPLRKHLAGVDMGSLQPPARAGVLQLMLDHNPHWMPGRQALRQRYTHYLEQIPLEHRSTIETFAKSHPAMGEVFQPPADRLVRPFALRAVAEGGSMSNAFLMAHPGAAMLQSLIKRLRLSYDLIDATARLAVQRGVALSDRERMSELANEALEKFYGPLGELPAEQEIFAAFLAHAAACHFSDGIRLQSELTIYLTGPGAMRDSMGDYERTHFTPVDAQVFRADTPISALGTINRDTEEEQDHSWKDNETDPEQWLKTERQRWSSGEYKTRYAGDIGQLLKGSTLVFEQGWPKIEGRTVLLTDVLQHLVDTLGEPFIRAMRLGHDGPVIFEHPLPLSYAERQLIRQQPASALPPPFLSVANTQALGLDEVLVGMGRGELSLDEITPLQRLALGALIGADSLHGQAFLALTGELDNLANQVRDLGVSNRYAVIERHLYQRQDRAFLNGLAADLLPTSAVGALALKKSALKDAHTQRQWGRQVGQIQHVATLEHRMQINEQTDRLLGSFDFGSFAAVPQDFLLGGRGEAIGGRCYPLALLMSAALTEGSPALQRLRERFFLAVIEPGKNDSIAFKHAVEELRGIALSDVGTPLGHADLTQISAALESRSGPRMLMLNSDNHSMLAAKTVAGGVTTYHFYDPNFGLFGFSDAIQFQQALEHFFVRQKMAGYYAAYGDETRPQFNLAELHAERISSWPLSGAITAGTLLSNEPLPEQPEGSLRQRLNSAHGRSLIENAHLGASLLGLDSHWWGQEIAAATAALQKLHAGATPLVPLFETLQVTPEGSYRLSLINPSNPAQVVEVLSEDHRLLRIKTWLSGQFSTLARKPQRTAHGVDPTEAGSVHTLNAGFTLQALMNTLRGREGEARTLTTAVRLHGYVNYAQLVHGNVVDVVGLIRLVRTALNEQKVIARTVGPVVSEALGHAANEGVGAVLGLANVGFDVYQLATAEDEVEKAQFGTQLAFDSASLALTAGGIGAALAGASTAAAVLGGAGVILGGLAVGFAALAQGFTGIARDAEAVGNFFADMEHAYRGVGFHFDARLGAWTVQPALLVKSIDLANGKLRLDSPKLYPLRDHIGVTDYDLDYDRAIDIRQQLKLPGEIVFTPPAKQTIVLPCTPQTCYGYEYKALPFGNLRDDRGFDTARRLEKKNKNGNWLFRFSFYSFPCEYILHRLYADYRQTVIEVQLDAVERVLVAPSLPSIWEGKVSYRICGAGASCTLALSRGYDIELQAPSGTRCSWVLEAGWARVTDIRVELGELYIGNVHLKLSGRGRHTLRLRIADQQLFQVDQVRRQLAIIEQSAPAGLDEQALLTHYKMLANEHRLLLPYTPIHQWPIPFESPQQPRYVTGWYDAHEERFLYIRNEGAGETDEAQLALVVNGYAYFYVADSYDIWQVDTLSGLIKHRFRVLLEGDSLLDKFQVDAHGVIHFVQTVSAAHAPREFGYLIHDGQLLLGSVTYGQHRELQATVFASDTLVDWPSVLGNYLIARSHPEKDGVTTVEWQPAAYVSVCWAFDPGKRDMVWIRSADRLLIHPQPLPRHARGWKDSIKHLGDLMLMPMTDTADVFFIYNRIDQTLCRQERTVRQGQAQWSKRWIEPAGLTQVVAVDGGYLLLDDEGRFFNLTAQGDVLLAGLDERWLQDRAQWWLALESIAKRYAANGFAIVGLRNVAGDGNLSAWFVNNRLLLCDMGRDKEVRLLGVTPDNQACWVFDLSSGAIWSQPLMDPQNLERAFGAGAQLLHADALPAPVPEWADWRFAEVRVDGSGLAGTTVEGVLLNLRYQESEVISGVNRHWVTAQGGPLLERLQTLLNDVDHEDFVFVESGPDSLQWYDVQGARLVRVVGKALPLDAVLLGTQHQPSREGATTVLLHEPAAGTVQTYPGMHGLGRFNYFQRNAQVVTIEAQDRVDDLLPLIPDDVSLMVLRLGQGHVTCRLSRAAWRRLDSLIIDCRHASGEVPAVPGKLIWEFDAPEKLLFEIVREHLLIIDPDSEHCLILRDVCSADEALRGEVFLAFNHQQSHAVSTWVQRLQAGEGRSKSMTLQDLTAVPAIAA